MIVDPAATPLTTSPALNGAAGADGFFGTLRDEVRDALGGIQGTIRIGGGEPASAEFSVGERRVMSGFALFVVAIIGVLVGMLLTTKKK